MKACFKCGERKPLRDFYKHPMMADGHLNKCKECARRDVYENRAKNIEYYKEYDRNRPNHAARLENNKRRAQTPKGKLSTARGHKQYRQRYPLKYAARVMVNNAIRDGRLTRAPCEVCGSTSRLHAHHEDYLKPFDVNWLCPAHHVERHKAMNAQRRSTQ